MARLARVVLPGVPHHITQRGVRSLEIFSSDEDRREYLSLLNEHGAKAGLEFLSYCLMNNHLHLLVIPQHEKSLREGIGETHKRYSRLVNFREKVRGHLFQERFFSCPLDLAHLSAAARYVERNPVRAGICRHAKDFPWSSARLHLGMIDRDPLVQQSQWFGSPDDWKEYLKEESHDLERFRAHFRTGRPLGDDRFLRKAEAITKRELSPKKPGRPKKDKN